MKILYFHQHFSTPEGTTGIRSYEMAKRLIERNHSVTLVCGSYGEGKTGLTSPFEKGIRRGTVDGIEIIEFDLAYSNHAGFLSRTWVFFQFALKSIQLALTERYDILFATSTPLTVAIPGIFARWLRRKPFVFEVRDLWPELPRAMKVIRNPLVLSAMSGLEWLSYHSAQRLIGLSPGIVEGITRRGIHSKRVVCIPNACDLALFNEKKASWSPPTIKDNDFVAIFAGTHGIANGLDAVLDAAAVLKDKGRHDIKILLIGQGKLKPALEARVVAEQLDNVVFHAPVDKKKLAGLMDRADLGLQILANVPAFYYGTSPNKFFDYLAAGLPVLNNYPGWVADLIKAHECGFCVPPNHPESFAEALIQAADDPDALRNKAKQATYLAEHLFDRRKLSNEFVDWLEGTQVTA
ncbi:MAG: glycosyltransferase family 4 protein [Legionella sp.]|nr:glycosyltransferase family 4 protein [Legionella sp.]